MVVREGRERLGRAAWRACWLFPLMSLVAVACGKTSDHAREGEGASTNVPEPTQSGAGGKAGGGAESGGTSLSGATAAGAVNATGEAGEAGAVVPWSGGGGARAEALAPLGTDDATLDQASGAELLELAIDIGYAHGYALCTCRAALPFPDSELGRCAEAESGFETFLEPARARCLLERSRSVPDFDELLRCRARLLRARGRNMALCPDDVAPGLGPEPVPTCEEPVELEELLNGGHCYNAFVCDDDTLLQDARCDRELDCPDGEDERGCGSIMCGDVLLDRFDACDSVPCQTIDAPLCTLEGGARVFCDDGEDLPLDKLCDGAEDCATGRDERYCF
jgi:hypothetical protein